MKCLLGLLRDGDAADIDPRCDLEQGLALAEEEQVHPWVAHAFSRRTSLQPEMSARLERIKRDAAIAAFYWSSELERILQAFGEEGIRVVPLKGPFLAERLYGDASLRVSHDLDLLIAQGDLVRGERVLSALGFKPETPDDYHRQWRKGHTSVELHHDVDNPLAFDFDIRSVLKRAQQTSFHGQRCWLLAPRDELLYLCLHGVRHRFERISLVLDLCLAFERLDLSSQVHEAPEVAQGGTLLALGLAMARRLRPAIPAPPFALASPAQLKHSELVADRLWHRLLTTSAQPLDWRALHAFYLEIELPGNRLRGRINHFRILLARVIEADYVFAAGLGCTSAWQVRLLRPVRLIRDAILR